MEELDGVDKEYDMFKELKKTQLSKARRRGGEQHRVRPETGRGQIRKGHRTHESEGRWLDDVCTFSRTILAAMWVEERPGVVIDDR